MTYHYDGRQIQKRKYSKYINKILKFMQELPKAEKFFKEIVNQKIQRYKDKSDQIVQKYLKQKQQAHHHSLELSSKLNQLKRQVNILKAIQHAGIQAQTNDIHLLIEQYQAMIQSYENSLIKEDLIENYPSDQRQKDQYLSDQIQMQSMPSENILKAPLNASTKEQINSIQIANLSADRLNLTSQQMQQSYFQTEKYVFGGQNTELFSQSTKHSLFPSFTKSQSITKRKLIAYGLKTFQLTVSTLLVCSIVKLLFFV